jgi:hypothetical protein
MRHRVLVFALAVTAASTTSAAPLTHAAPAYTWTLTTDGTDTLSTRFAPPAGATRSLASAGTFSEWLRGLPLLPSGTPVHLCDGSLKDRQDDVAAVVDLDTGPSDLQQCADVIMRLRAEYLYSQGLPIAFHPQGPKHPLTFTQGTRAAFDAYLRNVFVWAGSASLQDEMTAVGSQPIQPGDTLSQGGWPGHVVVVLDVANAPDGTQYVLLAQSYMPAQQLQVLANTGDPSLSPWFDACALDTPAGLETPEWRPYFRKDVYRFAQ